MEKYRSYSSGPASPLAEPFLKPNRHANSRKVHLAWEQAELMSHGIYGDFMQRIAARYPELSPTELRIAALVKAQMQSWRIAELLGICEDTVENHRIHIRRKIGHIDGTLQEHLKSL
jgi:DNA-binding CsgD family transcriptional regulator